MKELKQLNLYSQEWFEIAFKDCTTTAGAKKAAIEIVQSYHIQGIRDPSMIASLIDSFMRG